MKHIFPFLFLWFFAVFSLFGDSDVLTPTETLINEGHFAEAKKQLNADSGTEQGKDAERLREIMRRTLLEFSLTEEEMTAQLKERLPSVDENQIAVWTEQGCLESKVIDGTRRWFYDAVPNLFLINPDLRETKTAKNPTRWARAEAVQNVSKGEGDLTNPVYITFQFTAELPADAVPAGETVRCWMPCAHDGLEVQRNVQILETDPEPIRVSGPEEAHAYLYFEKKAEKGKPTRFYAKFRYESCGQYFSPDYLRANVKPYDRENPIWKTYTVQRIPHVLKTDRYRQLARDIVGSASNPVDQVNLVYEWINAQIPWASANEYSTLLSIPENTLDNRRGDCGMKALLMISLLRSLDIPARWESGWVIGGDGSAGMHDWLCVYYEGIGWVPTDVSFGWRVDRTLPASDFYKTGRDPYRLIVNEDYGASFIPAKEFYRSEPVDFQRGEMEWRGGNFYFPEWKRTVKAEVTPIGDAALLPLSAVPPKPCYRDPKAILYQTGPSIAVSKGGRIWVSIMTGGTTEENRNYVDLITSGDGGETWSEPKFAMDIPGPLRTFDPALWPDPEGRVWWFGCQVYDFWDGRGGLWTMICENPDDENAVWNAPRRLCDGVMKDKPLVTREGDYWIFVEQWTHRDFHKKGENQPWYHFDTSHIGANIYASSDKGKTFHYFSTIPVSEKIRTCDEHMAVELKNGTYRALLRTLDGMGESHSDDGGKTWTETIPSEIKNPPARFYFGRLKSGNILLVKNGPIDIQTNRRDIIAYLSEDDGKTFPYALPLDMRELPSYPDVSQGEDGIIYSVHDYDRQGVGEIILDVFTEDDIRSGKIVSPQGKLHRIIRKNWAGEK